MHLEFSEALHSMGRNETFLIDPEPLVKRYTTLSEDFENRLRDLVANRPVGAGEIRELIEFFHNEKFTWKLVWAFLAAGQVGSLYISPEVFENFMVLSVV